MARFINFVWIWILVSLINYPYTQAQVTDPSENLKKSLVDSEFQNLSELKEIFYHLASLYERDELGLADVRVPSFSPNQAGEDGGYGVHVVKRVNRVSVNEHWPLVQGQVRLPDEIRVRIDRGSANQLPLYARFRILWKPIRSYLDGSPHPKTRPGGVSEPFVFLEPQSSGGRPWERRVPISRTACTACHPGGALRTNSSNGGYWGLSKWLSENHARLHLNQSRPGWKELLEQELLLQPNKSLRLPNMKQVFTELSQKFDLTHDEPWIAEPARLRVLPQDIPNGEVCFESKGAAQNFQLPDWTHPSVYLAREVVHDSDRKNQKWCRRRMLDALQFIEQNWRLQEPAYHWWSDVVGEF